MSMLTLPTAPSPPSARPHLLGSAKPLLALAVIAALGLVAWLGVELLSEPKSTAAASSGDRVGARPGAVSPGETPMSLTEAPTIDAPGAQPSLLENSEVAQRTAHTTRANDSDALWVEGNVLLPDGTPLDERVFVESREPSDVRKGYDRVEVDGKGKFRVAFPADANNGWLRVHGRYIWFMGSLGVRPGKTPVDELQLEVVLGGRVEGSLALEDGGFLPGGELEISLEGQPDSGGHRKRMRQIEVTIKREEDGRIAKFSADAVPPGLYNLVCSPDGHLSRIVEEFRVLPGEVLLVDLNLVPAPTLRGRVLDEDGEPVADAEVRASGQLDEVEEGETDMPGLALARRESKTNENGYFTLPGVYPGKVNVVISADGFTPLAEDFQTAGPKAENDLVLTLAWGGVISGRVLFADGMPAAGASVTAKTLKGLGMRSTFRRNGSLSTVTDSEGNFFISALDEEAEYTVLSSLAKPKDKGGYAVAREEDIPAGSRDLVLTLGPGYSIQGRVVDLAGKPLKRFAISVRPVGTFSFMMDPEAVGILNQRVRDEDGAFFIDGLLPGEWNVKVIAGGYNETEELLLELPPQPSNLVIEMYELSTLRGFVYGPDGKPVAKASVTYRREGAGFDMSSFGDKKTNRRGQFRFGGVAPGTLRVKATGEGYAPAEEMTFELGREESRDNLVLRLTRGATIQGQVTHSDGTPAPDASVRWRSNEEGFGGDGIAVDKEGRFKATGIPAGTVVVSADIAITGGSGNSNGTCNVSEERVLVDGDVWAPILAAEQRTMLDTTVEVRRNDEPWGGTTLSLSRNEDGLRWSINGETNDSGNAQLDLPGPGSYNYVIGRRRGSLSGTCKVDGTGRVLLEFSLGKVEGHVSAPTGEQPIFVSVTLRPKEGSKGSEGVQQQRVDVDEEGNFESDMINSGTYEIRASGPTVGGTLRSSEWQEVRITHTRTAGPIELTMDQTSTIEGGMEGFFQGIR
ncbi:MAG: hypothetical protein ACI8QS_000820 [Planctomycetota bacterium]|jgi:hypothetical protein